MSKADELRAKNKRVRAAQQQDNPPARTTSSVRSTPVRATVDLPPATHAQLKRWLADAAVETGQASVSSQSVLRALIDRLLTDEGLTESIRQDISNY